MKNNIFILVVITMIFVTTSLFSQEQQQTSKSIINDGKVISFQGRPNSSKFYKSELKAKYLEIDKLTYEEALAAKKKYTDEGWEYTGMSKCENGTWNIYFKQE